MDDRNYTNDEKLRLEAFDRAIEVQRGKVHTRSVEEMINDSVKIETYIKEGKQ